MLILINYFNLKLSPSNKILKNKNLTSKLIKTEEFCINYNNLPKQSRHQLQIDPRRRVSKTKIKFSHLQQIRCANISSFI